MGRRPAYEMDAVVGAVSDLFGEHGYRMTSIGDIEARTGVDRSSLYHAFGNKQGLFEVALGRYLDEFQQRLARVLEAGAGVDAVARFFVAMAQAFRTDPDRSSRGCLVVNTVAELDAGDSLSARIGTVYRESLREAFASALSRAAARGEVDATRVRPRANLLSATVMGLFVTARIDPADAADVCDAAASEVSSWRLG